MSDLRRCKGHIEWVRPFFNTYNSSEENCKEETLVTASLTLKGSVVLRVTTLSFSCLVMIRETVLLVLPFRALCSMQKSNIFRVSRNFLTSFFL